MITTQFMDMTVILSLLLISACAGTLLIGIIGFLYLNILRTNPLYLSILFIGIISLLTVCSEIFVTVFGLSGEIYLGMQIHRLEALFISMYLFSIPFLCHQLLDLNYRLKKINEVIYISGACLAAILIIAAFVFPDTFLSFTKNPGSVITPWNAARATPMFLYRIRDLLIGLTGFYCLGLIIFEINLINGYRRLRLILIGLLTGMAFGGIDLLFGILEMKTGIYSIRIFLFSNIGFTVFTILSMISIINMFIGQERSLEIARRNENWGLLAGGVAHDFNNFLNGIIGYTSLALLETKQETLISTYLSEIKKASDTAKNIIGQLLAFSKDESQKREAISMTSLIKEIVQFVLIDSNVTASYHFSPGLRNAYIDKHQIFQVIQNLVVNSVHAMPKGGLIEINAENYSKTIDSYTLKAGEYLKISFRDNGTGISKKNLDLIFEPYFSTKKEGSGLGLAISFTQIKKNNGHIEAASETGKGSVFTIYLPATDKPEEK